ncbi:hypothetical protein M8756_06135 [Lutimaribacter sp. EGI FJ00015]|uniref:Uncharacterized protein n=1 Tax=Lutimaribacter degradans TaxID=2945989 RepID=A0ACC5ZUA5_9RHOB|nr:hypothetical protein [Lutimaribacter sp. EGI FJ00013]MCM2561410.1 hypothetical protein [Lutimaribacter sp. EGI FJ00013]MCO0612880.1 hypothetical protein [Lutimaribacter sp. EGI FJ00015]MCO0635538.1 hypothetical protein [Lutimaribacter sp. EGI FJ00014]
MSAAPETPEPEVALITFLDGHRSKGAKATGSFRRNFVQALRARGIRAHRFAGLRKLFAANLPRGSVVALSLNEDEFYRNLDLRLPAMAMLSSYCRTQGLTLIHGLEQALVLANKRATSEVLRLHSVPTPSLSSGEAATKVFSNSLSASHQAVEVLPPGAELDAGRFNVDYVDCRHQEGGQTYHVCLRALCVGPDINFVYVRARDVEHGGPSVHNVDTPQDLGLIRALHDRLVRPNEAHIQRIAAQVSHALGFGFFGIDILAAADGRLMVCEVGVKFNDVSYETHMYPIREGHPNETMLNGAAGERAAALLARRLSK